MSGDVELLDAELMDGTLPVKLSGCAILLACWKPFTFGNNWPRIELVRFDGTFCSGTGDDSEFIGIGDVLSLS